MPTFEPSELQRWCLGTWQGAAPGRAGGVSIDSRTLRPGQLYIALPGEHVDGHAFVADAFARGASAAMVERNKLGAIPGNRPILVVENTRRALLDLGAGYRATLEADMIAVTGSVGKTTVKEMIADSLSAIGPTARTRGNWNNDIGLPLSLLEVEPGARYGVFELGMNHPGELRPLARILRPKAAVVTTVGPVHLEYFDSVEAIAREKASILGEVPADGLVVLSRDDKYFDLLRSEATCRVVTTSLGGDGDFQARRESGSVNRFVVIDRTGGDEGEFVLEIPGEFILRDALFAIALGRSLGVGWNQLAAALKEFRPPGMRWQRETIDGIDFINDAYNANPLSMQAALEAFTHVDVRGKKWLVLAGMRELGGQARAEHESLGAEIARGPWAGLFAVGVLGSGIAEGALHGGMPAASIHLCESAAAAARRLAGLAKRGDAVLLKASRGEKLEDVLQEWKQEKHKEKTNHASG